VKYQKKNILIT